MIKDRKAAFLPPIFLLSEGILYYFILTASGRVLMYTSFLSVVLCFAFALLCSDKSSILTVFALACTVGADFFLVLQTPAERIWGMVFFLVAQTLYAVKLHLCTGNKPILFVRILLTVLAEAVALIVLGSRLDALAAISMCYYANLLINIIEGFTVFSKNRLFPIGLLLFILCDTVIGLQVAASGYLPIGPNSLLHKIIFMDFNLSWFFYLPSQVLISMSTLPRSNQ
ncbi:MAG: hypothetical protein J6Q53_04100 [Oscillospiraceae bacterium]|nr:hypothetical protein [Oscillospiraceae bacterium]